MNGMLQVAGGDVMACRVCVGWMLAVTLFCPGCIDALKSGEDGVRVGGIAQQTSLSTDVPPATDAAETAGLVPTDLLDEAPDVLLDVLEMADADLEEIGDGRDETEDTSDSDLCLPDCEGKECGWDGCDGTCGLCPSSKPTCNFGQCTKCTPDCGGKVCGADGCGGVCGACPPAFACIQGRCNPPPCQVIPPIFSEDFTQCTQGQFDVVDYQPQDSVSWWGTAMAPWSSPCSLYLGDLSRLTYDTGDRVRLELISPLIQIPSTGIHALRFMIRLALESVPAPEYPYDYDVVYVYADIPNIGSELVFSSKQLLNNTNGEYVPVAINLMGMMGYTLRFRFSFDTVDSIDNAHFGILLDDVVVSQVCPFCTEDLHCDDLNECSQDRCVEMSNTQGVGLCFHFPMDDCCSDGEQCGGQ